jgi:O-acetyl-ADP-ribose deacetylase (regulator of RNase III)
VLRSITAIECDAIVNSANKYLRNGCGVCGVIHHTAGSRLKDECDAIAQRFGGELEVGDAVVTDGYDLPFAKHIIHAVSPRCMMRWSDNMEAGFMKTYYSILDISTANSLKTIAIPAIGTGAVHCDPEKTAKVAFKSIKSYLENKPTSIEKITFAFTDERICEVYSRYF